QRLSCLLKLPEKQNLIYGLNLACKILKGKEISSKAFDLLKELIAFSQRFEEDQEMMVALYESLSIPSQYIMENNPLLIKALFEGFASFETQLACHALLSLYPYIQSEAMKKEKMFPAADPSFALLTHSIKHFNYTPNLLKLFFEPLWGEILG